MNPIMMRQIPADFRDKIGSLIRGTKPDGVRALLDYLITERERLDGELRAERDEIAMRRKQGAAQAIEDILTELERVSEVQRPWKTQ